jgi:hypothetical protein
MGIVYYYAERHHKESLLADILKMGSSDADLSSQYDRLWIGSYATDWK